MTKNYQKLYFAYGSCMDLNGRITEAGMADHFEKIGIARLDGYCFRLNKKKMMEPSPPTLCPIPQIKFMEYYIKSVTP
jgi:hypothetical protein